MGLTRGRKKEAPIGGGRLPRISAEPEEPVSQMGTGPLAHKINAGKHHEIRVDRWGGAVMCRDKDFEVSPMGSHQLHSHVQRGRFMVSTVLLEGYLA